MKMKFYRTSRAAELKDIVNAVIEAVQDADKEYSSRKNALAEDFESEKITQKHFDEESAKALDVLKARYSATRDKYGKKFDTFISLLNQLADAVTAPPIDEAEKNAVLLLQSMQQPTQAAFDAARDAWKGSPLTQAILDDIARNNMLQFDRKPRTDFLTAQDVRDIADNLHFGASLYLQSLQSDDVANLSNPMHGREMNAAHRATGERVLRELTARDNPFDFNGNTTKSFAFDDLCDSAELNA